MESIFGAVLAIAVATLACVALISVCVLAYKNFKENKELKSPDDLVVQRRRFVRYSNLYDVRRYGIPAIALWATILISIFVNLYLGGVMFLGVLLRLLFRPLQNFALRTFVTPDRLIVYLRPFCQEQGFEVLPCLLKAIAPFGRVVALQRYGDPAGDDGFSLLNPKKHEVEAAEDVAQKVLGKDIKLKHGTLVRCSDLEWRVVIRYWMKLAKLVIVDCGRIGTGLEWEIKTLCQYFGPDQVVFCIPAPDNDLLSATDGLATILGDWYPTRRRIIQYPRSPSTADLGEITGELSSNVIQCLILSSAASNRTAT